MLDPVEVHQRLSPVLDEIQALIEALEADQATSPNPDRQTILADLRHVDMLLTGIYLTT